MRRKDRQITDFDQIIGVMRRCEVCHVAFRGKEYPYVVPMNFGMEVDCGKVFLYFHGAMEGKKHCILRNDPKVAFVMERSHGVSSEQQKDPCQSTYYYESVMGTGVMESLEGMEKINALKLLSQRYRSEPDDFTFSAEQLQHTSVYKLSVQQLTGKQNLLE